METSSQEKRCWTWKPTTAGILSIIGGGINLISVITRASVGRFGMMRGLYTMGGYTRFGPLEVVLIILGVVAIVGGVFALRRRIWGLALAGAICALFPPRIIVLGILSVIFIVLSKREFAQSSSSHDASSSL